MTTDCYGHHHSAWFQTVREVTPNPAAFLHPFQPESWARKIQGEHCSSLFFWLSFRMTLWTQGLTFVRQVFLPLSHSASHFFLMGISEIGSCQVIVHDCLWTTILPDLCLPSTVMSHRCQALFQWILTNKYNQYTEYNPKYWKANLTPLIWHFDSISQHFDVRVLKVILGNVLEVQIQKHCNYYLL
jgi:hypothetical protein